MDMIKKIFLINLFIILIFSTFLLADNKDQTLRFNAVSSGWPPYSFLDTKGNPAGILVDALPLFLKNHHYTLEVTTYPLVRAEKAMEEGQIDVMIRSKNWTKNPNDFYWSDPIILNRDIILSLKKSPIEFNTLENLRGKRIGTIYGFKYPTLEPLFNSKKLERIDAQNTENSLKMLVHHHVDGIVISEAVAKWMIRNDKDLKDTFHFSKNIIDQNSIEYRFRKDDRLIPIIKIINEAIAKNKIDKSFDKLIEAYQ